MSAFTVHARRRHIAEAPSGTPRPIRPHDVSAYDEGDAVLSIRVFLPVEKYEIVSILRRAAVAS